MATPLLKQSWENPPLFMHQSYHAMVDTQHDPYGSSAYRSQNGYGATSSSGVTSHQAISSSALKLVQSENNNTAPTMKQLAFLIAVTDRKNKLHFPVRTPVFQLLITPIMSTFSAHEPPGTAGSCSTTRGK